MFIFGRLFIAIAGILHIILQVGILLFIVRAIMSWFQPDPRQPVVAFIYRIADPTLDFIRRYVPSFGTVDISPLIAILICWFLDSFLVGTLSDIGYQLLR